MSVYFDYLLDRDLVRHVAQASNEKRDLKFFFAFSDVQPEWQVGLPYLSIEKLMSSYVKLQTRDREFYALMMMTFRGQGVSFIPRFQTNSLGLLSKR